MIKIGFRPIQHSIGAFSRVLNEPAKHFNTFAQAAPSKIFWQYHIYLDTIFAAEGIPEWAALAIPTIINRLHLGFPPEHPILERTGAFKAAIISKGSPGFVYQHDSLGGGSLRLRFGTTDPRFIWFQEGTEHMPARPIMPDTRNDKQALCHMMESVLVPALEDAIYG